MSMFQWFVDNMMSNIGYETLMWYKVSIHWVILIIGMHMEDYMRSTTYNIYKKK